MSSVEVFNMGEGDFIEVTPSGAVAPVASSPSFFNGVGDLAGRSVRCISEGVSVVAKMFASPEGTEKLLKLASFSMILAQLHLARFAAIASTVGKRLGEGAKFLKVRNFTAVFTYWVLPRAQKDGSMKCAWQKDGLIGRVSMAFLQVAVTCEQALWLGAIGVVNLGAAGAALGRVPLVGVLASIPLARVQMVTALVGVGLAAVGAGKKIYQEGSSKANWLKVADNVGKIGLIAFSSWAFSSGFAAWGIAASLVGIAKVAYKVYGESLSQKEASASVPSTEAALLDEPELVELLEESSLPLEEKKEEPEEELSFPPQGAMCGKPVQPLFNEENDSVIPTEKE